MKVIRVMSAATMTGFAFGVLAIGICACDTVAGITGVLGIFGCFSLFPQLLGR